ncbi:hypothetical protein CBS101457_001054 [Exobasidium rhododendri]|nr:hypothetical protein CBS101457_001054 [Exobasidium rhododendri]
MSTFTPSTQISAATSPRDWAYELGRLPPTASIVFTKASLIEFLKTHGIEVGPNNTEINKLPRYATIGKLEQPDATISATQKKVTPPPAFAESPRPSSFAAPAPKPIDEPRSEPLAYHQPAAVSKIIPQEDNKSLMADRKMDRKQEIQVRTPDGEVFRPTRRVREPVGGGSVQIGALFGGESNDYDETVREAEKEQAKRRGIAVDETVPVTPLRPIENQQQEEVEAPSKASTVFRPTRRVRDPGGTGGQSSIALG